LARIDPRGVSNLDLGYRTLKLKITLAAMADVEDALGCDFAEIEHNLGSTKRIAAFIAALARGAGEEITDEDVEKIRRAPITVQDIMAALPGAAPAEDIPEKNADAPSA
jgi:hypothetical protein